jgi:hypothetical protein
MFMLRNTQRAAARGYSVGSGASGAVSIGVGDQAPTVVRFCWQGEGGDPPMEEIERDGRRLLVPRYGRGDIVEEESTFERVSPPTEAEAEAEAPAFIPVPEPVLFESAPSPEPESAQAELAEPEAPAPLSPEAPSRPELDLGFIFRERFRLLSRANDCGEGRLRAIEHTVTVTRRELGLDLERAKRLVLAAIAKS